MPSLTWLPLFGEVAYHTFRWFWSSGRSDSVICPETHCASVTCGSCPPCPVLSCGAVNCGNGDHVDGALSPQWQSSLSALCLGLVLGYAIAKLWDSFQGFTGFTRNTPLTDAPARRAELRLGAPAPSAPSQSPPTSLSPQPVAGEPGRPVTPSQRRKNGL